jgi:hypothetical protein
MDRYPAVSNAEVIGATTEGRYTTTTTPDEGLSNGARPFRPGVTNTVLPCMAGFVYIVVTVFFIVMIWRLVKGVEKIADVLERHSDSGPNRPQA